MSAAANSEVVAQYAKPKTNKYQQAAEEFRNSQLFERVARYINSDVKIRGTLTLVAAECGTINAFYDPTHRAIVLCYEMLENISLGIAKDMKSASYEEIADTAAGAILFVIYHELGHALIHIYNIPVFAREEDSADAISSYFLLRSPNRVASINGAMWSFRQKSNSYGSKHFADEHSLDEQRKFNIICFAIGSDPQAFALQAQKLGLPPERSSRCRSEYQKLVSSVNSQLGTRVRQ